MPGVRWLVTENGKLICNLFPLLCGGDIIGAFVSADKTLDSYDRYTLFLEREPG